MCVCYCVCVYVIAHVSLCVNLYVHAYMSLHVAFRCRWSLLLVAVASSVGPSYFHFASIAVLSGMAGSFFRMTNRGSEKVLMSIC